MEARHVRGTLKHLLSQVDARQAAMEWKKVQSRAEGRNSKGFSYDPLRLGTSLTPANPRERLNRASCDDLEEKV